MAEFSYFIHPRLGKLQGVILSSSIVQFRNVLYATTLGRWQKSSLVDELTCPHKDDAVYDATTYSTMAPQHNKSIDFEFSLIQKTLPLPHDYTCDEYKCLNLTLTMPKRAHSTDLLPVLVFIHGGGFFVGSHSWPQNDLSKLVELSMRIDKPVVAVAIHYRLGLLGFLSSEELSPPTEAGNYGLSDQHNALLWVQRNIRGFGGDPSNVTIFGESAGSISVWLHLLRQSSTGLLFKRAMCMSGDARLRSPKPLENNELVFQAVLEEFGVKDESKPGRRAALEKVPWQDLVSISLNTRCFPTLSNGYNGFVSDHEELRNQIRTVFSRCKTLVVGDCHADATALAATLTQTSIMKRFQNCFLQYFSGDEVHQLISHYQLDQSPGSEQKVHPGFLQLVTDIRFYLPNYILGSLSDKSENLQVYHFHEPNPWEGPFKNQAGHVLDVAYAFQNYQQLLPPESQAVSTHMGVYLIELANGLKDQPSLDQASGERLVTVFDAAHSQVVMTERDYDQKYRNGSGAFLMALGIDRLGSAVDAFQFGRH